MAISYIYESRLASIFIILFGFLSTVLNVYLSYVGDIGNSLCKRSTLE